MNFLDDAEPFRIKMVEPIRKTTREEREKLVKAADFNIFKIPAGKYLVTIVNCKTYTTPQKLIIF